MTTISVPPRPPSYFLRGDFSHTFCKSRGCNQKKNECLGGIERVPATDISLGGATMFLVKQDFVK